MSLSRKLTARTPLIAGLTGIVIVLSSVFFLFVEDDFRRVLGVAGGLFVLLLAVWYAANPFLKNERTYPDLRREVGAFINMARELHYASINDAEDTFDDIEARIASQVSVVIATARSSGKPD